jgi:hypothetical protein
MNAISLNIRDGLAPRMRAILDHLSGSRRVRLNRQMGRGVQNLCQRHVLSLAATRHATANKLGAAPTHFLAGAAAEAAQPQALRADESGATLTIVHPAIGRAGHEVKIRPTGGRQYLTIPISPEAYGQTLMQGGNPRFPKAFFFASKKGNLLYGVKTGRTIHPLYALKTEVHLKQDRTLLPSDREIKQTAIAALQAGLPEKQGRRKKYETRFSAFSILNSYFPL